MHPRYFEGGALKVLTFIFEYPLSGAVLLLKACTPGNNG